MSNDKQLAILCTTAVILFGLLAYTFSQYLNLNTAIISYKKQVEEYKTKESVSITYDQINKNKIKKITSYIKTNYRRTASPVAKLIAESTVELAKQFNLPEGIIMGIMEVESSFEPSQVSNATARGLMQVRWSVWERYLNERLDLKNEFDLHEIDKGINAGILVFKYYVDKNNGDMTGALYDYVGKSKDYAEKVYKSMGRFMLYE